MCVEELVTNIWSSPHLNLRDFPLANRRSWLAKVRIEREKRMLRGISRSSPSWKLRSIRTFATPVSITDDVTTGGFINSLAGNDPTLLGNSSIFLGSAESIRVALTDDRRTDRSIKMDYLRTGCRCDYKTDIGCNNWNDEWFCLWTGFIYCFTSKSWPIISL